jgi:hypothetical protein
MDPTSIHQTIQPVATDTPSIPATQLAFSSERQTPVVEDSLLEANSIVLPLITLRSDRLNG